MDSRDALFPFARSQSEWYRALNARHESALTTSKLIEVGYDQIFLSRDVK